MSESFHALRVTLNEDRSATRRIEQRSIDDLPDGEVLIRVSHSSLNYKDALSATGNKGVTRQFPHTPGIDAAGQVAHSETPAFAAGDEVLVTGFDLGMNTDGGFAEYIRVPADWVVKRPAGLSAREAMIYGTAGLTAAISIDKLRRAGVEPDSGEILVTGASGGVGCIGVALLAKLGYTVVAGSGKPQAREWLGQLGASEILSREAMLDESTRPLLKERWAGVLDTVGGQVLETALRSTRYAGAVSCCGLVASPTLATTVFPFILRGIDLLGVDSVELPMSARLALWQKLAGDWRLDSLESIATEVDLATLDSTWIDRILAGGVQGRTLVTL